MMTREKTWVTHGGVAAIMLVAGLLVGCQAGEDAEDAEDRIAIELSDPADTDTGTGVPPVVPQPAPLDTSPPDTIATNEPPWPRADCIAAVKPDRVIIQDEPMLITYTFGTDFPKPDSVLSDTNSGISIESLDKDLTLVRLNLSRATEGRWVLRFLGSGERACDATLTVRRPS